jgi:hypothetical protein
MARKAGIEVRCRSDRCRARTVSSSLHLDQSTLSMFGYQLIRKRLLVFVGGQLVRLAIGISPAFSRPRSRAMI